MINRDGQGWPVVNGRRLPQVLIRIGRLIERRSWGISICGGMNPDVPYGMSFYEWELKADFIYDETIQQCIEFLGFHQKRANP